MSAKLKRLFSLSMLITFSLLSLSLSIPVHPDAAALLSFKSSSDSSNSLSSWSNSSSDPCSWRGVTCNPFTRRVIKLVLNELNLTGSLESLTRLTHLRHLSLHHNRLSSAPENFTSWPNLKHIYLSHNRFHGKFPLGIPRLHRLHRIDLSHNRFSGQIPLAELTQLPHLLTLRLEFNSFTGTLHSGDQSSTSISDFNVSGNNLVGKIPSWLSNFPETSFAANKNLCGDPLPTDCPTAIVPSNQTVKGEAAQVKSKRGTSNRVVLMIVGIDAVVVLAALVTITCCCYKRGHICRPRKGETKRNCSLYNGHGRRGVAGEGDEMVYFEGCRGFTKVDDLLKASAEMLGKGIVGTTYKVVVDSEDVVVVVKRVRERRRRKELDVFLREIGELRHPNLVSLRAYYNSKDELLLVYDFLPNGSLHSILHGNRGPGRTPLDWTTRLKLASGSARGLSFLHSYKKTQLFHGHLTTSNIIVDHLGNPCLSDAGIHQLLPAPSPANNAYKAPELLAGNMNQNAKFLQRCDVYSFGVVLLEILTGKMATSEGETSLARWVQRMVTVPENNWTWEVLDFELLRYKEMEEEMLALLRVALLCLAALPKDRPKMAAVSEMIEEIRTRGGSGRGGGTVSPANDLSCDSSRSLSESTPNFTSS